MKSNTDNAWASVQKLRSRAQVLMVVFVLGFIFGIILITVNLNSVLNPSFGTDVAASAAGLSFGIILDSLATTCLVGWFFAVSMANHAEVVYFSSSSNKERKEETVAPVTSSAPSLSKVLSGDDEKPQSTKSESLSKCSDCGVMNKAGEKYCSVCGGILN